MPKSTAMLTERQTSNPTPRASLSHHNIIKDILAQYQDLNEEGQKDLWLGALASNDTELIRELTDLCVKDARAKDAKGNSSTQLAKLTKDLLTHSEKHKVTELKYEEQAGRRWLYFHNWLTRLSLVIKMFSQTAPVFDVGYSRSQIVSVTEPFICSFVPRWITFTVT